MMSLLMTDYSLSATAACPIMGQTVTYEIANVCNPAYSVVCLIDRNSIPGDTHSGER